MEASKEVLNGHKEHVNKNYFLSKEQKKQLSDLKSQAKYLKNLIISLEHKEILDRLKNYLKRNTLEKARRKTIKNWIDKYYPR